MMDQSVSVGYHDYGSKSDLVVYVDCSYDPGIFHLETCRRNQQSYHPCFPNIQEALDHIIDVTSSTSDVYYNATVRILSSESESRPMRCSGKGNFNVRLNPPRQTSRKRPYPNDKSSAPLAIRIVGNDNRDSRNDGVVIDCDNKGRAFDLTATSSTPYFRSNARIQAFQDLTFERCTPNSTDLIGSGGAIIASLFMMKNRDSGAKDNNISLTFQRVTFRQNYARQSGGAVALVTNSDVNKLFQEYSFDSPLVSFIECVFEDNAVEDAGGAIYLGSDSTSDGSGKNRAYFKQCLFDSNSANNGGAVYAFSAGFGYFDIFEDCIFSNNIAKAKGGSIDYDSSTNQSLIATLGLKRLNASFINSIFRGNIALGTTTTNESPSSSEMTSLSIRGGAGGAIHASNSAISVDGCTFDRNEASDNSFSSDDDSDTEAMIIAGARGGAICLSITPALLSIDGPIQSNNSLLLYNSTFTNNAAKSTASSLSSYFRSAAGGALWMELIESNVPSAGQPVYIEDCIFHSNMVGTTSTGHRANGDTAGGALYFRSHPGHYEIDLVLVSSILSENVADYGGRGGSICIEGHGINITVRGSSFLSNRVTSSSDDFSGGGALALINGSKATITETKFIQNQALTSDTISAFKSSGSSGRGGAIYVYESSVYISDSIFSDNFCFSSNGDTGGCEGGALYLGPPMIKSEIIEESSVLNSMFKNNIAHASDPSMSHGVIESSSSGKGGAVFIYHSQPVFDACIFSSNQASAGKGGRFSSGGAISILYGANVSGGKIEPTSQGVIIRSCTFTQNIAGTTPNLFETVVSKQFDSRIESVISSRTGRGGAITITMSKLQILDSTLSSNMAIASLDSSLPSFAGAIFVDEISECSILNSTLSDNVVVNGFGSDVVVVDVELPDLKYKISSESKLNSDIKLLIQETNITSSSLSSSQVNLTNLLNESHVCSILSLGGTLEIGSGNIFTRTEIVAAGQGSEIGSSIVGFNVRLRDSTIFLNKNSDMSDLSVVAWNASVVVLEDNFLHDFSKNKPLLANLVLLGGKLSSCSGLSILGDFAIVEGMLDASKANSKLSLDVFGNFHSGLSDQDVRNWKWVPQQLKSNVTLSETYLHVHGNFFAKGTNLTLSPRSLVQINYNAKLLIKSNTVFTKERIQNISHYALINKGSILHEECDDLTFQILGGQFKQEVTGVINVTLPSKLSSAPFKFEALDVIGSIGISFCEDTIIDETSSWEVIAANLNETTPKRIQFNPDFQLPTGISVNFTERFDAETEFSETLSIYPGGIACESVLLYSGHRNEKDSCNICLSSSSMCTWDKTSLMCLTPRSEFQRDERSCCPESCNGRGSCDWVLGSCQCGWFYEGESCADISEVGLSLIAAVCGIIIIMLISILYWKFNRKSRKLAVTNTLEELRRELLEADEIATYDEAHDDIESSSVVRNVSPNQRSRRYISQGFIQDIQQQLFLKDVSISPKEVLMERQIGDGAFGDVYVGCYRETTVAIKVIRPNVLCGMSNEEVENFKREAFIMSRLRHPNIALFMGIVSVSDPTLDAGFESLYILSEFMDRGSLLDIIEKVNRQEEKNLLQPSGGDDYIEWGYERLLMCAVQAGLGMSYLHSHNPPICHRDLKSSNLLVDSKWVVKVADFGVSRIMSDGSSSSDDDSTLSEQHPESLLKTTLVGTVAWAAPEMLASQAKSNYTLKVDQYSFGMVLYELWERKRPFSELSSRFAIMDAVKDGQRPHLTRDCPFGYRSLMEQCLKEDPNLRPSFSYIVRTLKSELANIEAH